MEKISKITKYLVFIFLCSIIFLFLQKNTEIEKEIKTLKEDRIKLESEVDSLQKVNKEILDKEISLNSFIEFKEKEIKILKERVAKSKDTLNQTRKTLFSLREDLDSLKNTYPNRTGDDLINSIKLKTNNN